MSVKFIISQSFQIGVKQSYSDYLKKQIDLSEKRHLSFHIKYIKITHPPTDIFEIWYFILLIWSLTHYKEFHLCSVYGWYFSIFIEQWKVILSLFHYTWQWHWLRNIVVFLNESKWFRFEVDLPLRIHWFQPISIWFQRWRLCTISN